jgi:hypothetical protein
LGEPILIGRLSIPIYRSFVVLRNALAVSQIISKSNLSDGVTLLGCLLVPASRSRVVFRHTTTNLVQDPNPVLGGGGLLMNRICNRLRRIGGFKPARWRLLMKPKKLGPQNKSDGRDEPAGGVPIDQRAEGTTL